jgi:hypothetical protein
MSVKSTVVVTKKVSMLVVLRARRYLLDSRQKVDQLAVLLLPER